MRFVYTNDPSTHDFCESIGMPFIGEYLSERTVFWCFVLTGRPLREGVDRNN